MSIKVIQERLLSYQTANSLEEQNALKEITQEIALSALARAEFFKIGVLQGGTCLRIFHGLNRFSEDLDFSLQNPSQNFAWGTYLRKLQTELEIYGYNIQIQDRFALHNNVKIGFLKDDSIGKVLTIRHSQIQATLKIKLEIDTNPPIGGTFEQRYLEFPVTVPVLCDDLPSLFAGKSHALLCRKWEKGRDWYDFDWYVANRVKPNFPLLTNTIQQFGPWKNQGLQVTLKWYLQQIQEKIRSTDWNKQRQDVARFLKHQNLDLLKQWNAKFFLERADRLANYLRHNP